MPLYTGARSQCYDFSHFRLSINPKEIKLCITDFSKSIKKQ